MTTVLVNLHERGLSNTTINIARSAILVITHSEDKNTIGCHPLVSRFIKGIYKGSPPTPRYLSTWNVQLVLTNLASINPLDKLHLKMLVMLIAPVSAQGGQSLHILDIGPGCMKKVHDGHKVLLTAHIKQSRPGCKTPTVVLRAYPANPSHISRGQSPSGVQKLNFLSVLLSHTNGCPERLFPGGFALS